MKGPFYDQMQFVDIHRLLVKIPCPGRYGAQGTFFGTMPGRHDNLGVRFQLEHLVQHRKTFGHTVRIGRQTQVERNDIGFFGT